MEAYLRPLVGALVLEQTKAEHLGVMRAMATQYVPEHRRLQFEYMLREEMEDEDSDTVSEMREAVSYAIGRMTSESRRTALHELRRRLNESFGVLSLTAVPDDILMWSHYAGAHRGFVVELDTADAFFDQRIFPGDLLRRPRLVQYERERPPRALFEPKYWLRSKESASVDLLEYMAGVLLLTKSSHWAYEQEWRMVMPLERTRKTESGCHVLDVPPRCIQRVIAGSEMSAADVHRILDIVEHPDFFHVEVRRAVCDTRRFRVAVRDHESILEKRLLEDVERFPGDGVQRRIDRLQSGGPRFYTAQAALAARGWIAVPPFDRATQKRKVLELTEAGRARLDERRRAAAAWEESRKSKVDRLLDDIRSGKAAGRDIATEVTRAIDEQALETVRRDPDAIKRQMMPIEVMRNFASLGSDDEDVRWKAARALREVGDANVVEHLVSILRWHEYEELAWIHDPRQASNVTREEIKEIESDAPQAYWMLRDRTLWGSEELTRLAAYALGGIAARVAADEATDALVEALKAPDADTRWCAVEALGHIASPRALPELERLAAGDRTDTSFGVVCDAARLAVRRVQDAVKRGRPVR